MEDYNSLLSIAELNQLNFLDKVREKYNLKYVISYWSAVDILQENNFDIQVKFCNLTDSGYGGYGPVIYHIDCPPTRTLIKKYGNDLSMIAFVFNSEREKLTFILKWA